MKQYISAKIVNRELNDKERSKLKHSLKDRKNWDDGSFIKEPGLSIGEMIEFLDEEDDYFKTWYRQGNSKVSKTNKTISWEYNEELCDDLWQEVTKVLERN